jgi:hypothetical protein
MLSPRFDGVHRDLPAALHSTIAPRAKTTAPSQNTLPPLRVAAISLRDGAEGPLLAAVIRAFADCFESCETAKLALLPGGIPGSSWEVTVVGCATTYGAPVLFEGRDSCYGRVYRAYDPALARDVMRIRQEFANSREANKGAVSRILERCAPGREGSAVLGRRTVGLLVCGENNVLYNAQANDNEVSVRHHAGTSLFEHAHLICNGAHTQMGNWGKLDRRFEYLSRDGRCALYATNCTTRSWLSACRAYVDGKLVATGEWAAPATASARVVRDPFNGFRAVVLDLPRTRPHALSLGQGQISE